MNYLTFFNKLRNFFLSIFFIPKRPKISLLIPFSTDDPYRQANFNWLLAYWKHELPDAEIIIGESRGSIFCKGEALNDAVAKSTGKVLVILDADAYLDGKVITHCADLILENIHNHLWFVPYRRLYRLTKEATEIITGSDPHCPVRFPHHIPKVLVENIDKANYGHRYGAMCMIFHYKAYKKIGGFDERFKGWGGEDVCLLRALDTVYGKHKTTNNNIFHLWHSFFGHTYEERRWEGQDKGGSNWDISKRYGQAYKNPTMMKKLLEEAKEFRRKL
jgi:predicted glycosyltransferase involved in capsule biosynthesis